MRYRIAAAALVINYQVTRKQGWDLVNSDSKSESVADESSPKTAQEWANRGFAHINSEEYEEAFADFAEALRIDPKCADAYDGRARVSATRGDLEAAIDDFGLALEYSRHNPSALTHRLGVYILRGQCHQLLRNFEEQYQDFDEATRLDPDGWSTIYMRADASRRLHDYESAIDDYSTVVRLNPELSVAFYWRGQMRAFIGEFDQALSDYDEAIRLVNGNNAAHYWLRGNLFEVLDRLEDALKDYTEAIRLHPTEVSFYRDRSQVHGYLGMDEQADADHDRVLQLEAEERGEDYMPDNRTQIYPLVQEHFSEEPLESLTITERFFPYRVSADLQLGIEALLKSERKIRNFHAIERGSSPVTDIGDLWRKDRRCPVVATAPRYQEIDIGEETPVRCLREGLWLLESGGAHYALLLDTSSHKGPHFQVVSTSDDAGRQATAEIFHHLEEAINKGACYRGKVLSLEDQEQFSGMFQAIKVLKLPRIGREQVILSARTLDLLDRNVLHFVRQRPRLVHAGLPTRKGLLLYGPPGTGKTHTLHYLLGALQGHTAFVITAEQMGLLADYMTLARLYQPSVVIIEDVDLIGRQRTEMRSGGEETLLNRLLNEMDGLQTHAEVLFLLTTNNPESLEGALAGRPGRIDQAVEFPLPDEPCRARLARLYANNLDVADEVIESIVKRTDRVSASFIKELMRRAAQYHFERSDSANIDLSDVESALDELLIAGGSLNRKLLGAGMHEIG